MSDFNAPPPPGASPPPPSGPPSPPGAPYVPPNHPFPPGQPPPPGAWPGGPPGFPPAPPGYTPPPKKRSAWPWVLGALGILVALALLAAVVAIAASAGSEERSTSSAGTSRSDSSGQSSDVSGAADEVDDVGPCEWVDADTIVLDITNNSSEQSSYVIDVNFLDADGTRVADEPFFVDHVRSGERAVEPSFVFDSAGGVDCEIAEVERYSAASSGDVSEVTCVTSGVDFADDIASGFIATNGSSEVSDYFVTAAFVRDGVRIGTAFASIENVRPGESAPGEGFSTVDGPDDGVRCEVVDVTRTSSE